ncbi:hypothetical protein Rhal01_03831 [Rubritalea halochordaticola]|uniref:Uncharacterized protein n=1 Tax=Rubritalea halochordaticola TaxID=714537 RepID=A0ABP9V6F2_9BACT
MPRSQNQVPFYLLSAVVLLCGFGFLEATERLHDSSRLLNHLTGNPDAMELMRENKLYLLLYRLSAIFLFLLGSAGILLAILRGRKAG